MASECLIQVSNRINLRGVMRRNPTSEVAIVLTHPHPKLGGDMNNNVTQSLFGCLSRHYTVIAYNSRGVGGSTGSSSWRGTDEREDVKAVVRYINDVLKIPYVYLVGYSFGAAVACSMAIYLPSVVGYVAVSYPCGFLTRFILGHHITYARRYTGPKLWIIGDQDEFAFVSTIESKFDTLAKPKELEIVRGASHFWLETGEMSRKVEEWIKRQEDLRESKRVDKRGGYTHVEEALPISGSDSAFRLLMDNNVWCYLLVVAAILLGVLIPRRSQL